MTANPTADREIVVTRKFDAPREIVFAAFTEREHIEQWWAPGGATIHELNVKPGGVWRYSQPGPDGALVPYKVKFIEIASPTRLVYEFGTDAENAPEPVRTNVTFEDQNGKTNVTLQLVFASAAEREMMVSYGAVGGAQLALKSLADYLSKSSIHHD